VAQARPRIHDRRRHRCAGGGGNIQIHERPAIASQPAAALARRLAIAPATLRS